MKKILVICLSLVICIALFTACSNNKFNTELDEKLNDAVVATIEGQTITQADYNLIYKMMYDEMSQYSQYYGEDWINSEIDENGTTMGTQLKNSVIEQISYLIAACDIAEKEYGITKDDKSIKDAFNKSKDSVVENFTDEGYMDFLKTTRTTNEAVDTYLLRCEVFSKLSEKLTEEGGPAYIDDKEIIDEFSQSHWRVKHILISTQEETDENGNKKPARSEKDAQSLVKEVLNKIADGADFDELIEEYDEDPGMEKGGFYTFGEGEMVSEFEEASRNLAIGDYTKEGVKTSYGYHIIKRYDIDANDEAFSQFKAQQLDSKVSSIVEPRIKELKVDKEDNVIDAYVNEWVKELKKQQPSQNAAQ